MGIESLVVSIRSDGARNEKADQVVSALQASYDLRVCDDGRRVILDHAHGVFEIALFEYGYEVEVSLVQGQTVVYPAIDVVNSVATLARSRTVEIIADVGGGEYAAHSWDLCTAYEHAFFEKLQAWRAYAGDECMRLTCAEAIRLLVDQAPPPGR